jgi:pyruvate/2-oxoglutarate dehydrogenase complex dihydrolipoamide acyltransferase (E2) component
MSVVLRLLLATALTAAAVGGGVMLFTDDNSGAQTAAQATSAPLSSFDTSRLTVLRTGFCDGVADSAVEEALGAAPEQESSYANGDRVRLTEEVRDRAHEHGCVWSAGGVTAAGWVFAPPVPRATAETLIRRAQGAKSCEAVPDAPAYGDPSVALICTGDRGQEVSFRGLFGDAWLVCSIRTSDVSPGQTPDEAVDRTGRWCVAVAKAASAIPTSE